ncbi:MAG: hypothetical protein WA971_14110 [Microbacterium sp.]
MYTEPTTSSAPGISRRTTLKAAAWSVPVVAAAAAVPAYAAVSETAAIQVMLGGGSISQALNAARTRIASLQLTAVQFEVSGADPVPAGSTLILKWDKRLSEDIAPAINGSALVPVAPLLTVGNLISGTYTLPEIPVIGEPTGRLTVDLGYFPSSPGDWFADAEDIEPYTALVMAPAGSGIASGEHVEPTIYADTHDLAFVDSTWREIPVVVGGTAASSWVVEGVTVHSQGPGPVPAYERIVIELPTGLGEIGEVQGLAVSIDGQSVDAPLIDFGSGTYGIELTGGLPVNAELVATWTTVLPSGPIPVASAGSGSAWYNATLADRDSSNDSVTHA